MPPTLTGQEWVQLTNKKGSSQSPLLPPHTLNRHESHACARRPPRGIRDGVPTFDDDAYPNDDSITLRHVDCEELLKAVERIKPKVHVFGHVHSGHGLVEHDGTTFINASVMNESYDPEWKPYVFDLA